MPTNTHTLKVIGLVYQRDCFEVHSRCQDRETKQWSKWRTSSRNASTLEEAQKQVSDLNRPDPLAGFIDFGISKTEFRIAKVTATVEIVA